MPSRQAKAFAQGRVVVSLQSSLRGSAKLRGTVTKHVTPLTIYQTVGVVVEVTLRDHKGEVP